MFDLESQLRRFTHGPCPSHVRQMVEAANQARIGFGDLEDLRLYVALYPRCREFINEVGNKVLLGEIECESTQEGE